MVTRFRVLSALIMREMATRYGRSYFGYLWAVVEPIAYITIFTILFAQIARFPALGQSFALFFATGVLGFFFYRGPADVAGQAFSFNKALYLYPQVSLLDSAISRVLLDLITKSLVFFIVITGIILIEDVDVNIDLRYVAVAICLGGALGFGVGLVNCVLFALSQSYQRFFMIVHRPLFIISGVFFIPDNLPPALREVIVLNPVVHVVGLMRKGFYSTYTADWIDVRVTASVALCLMLVGLLLVRRYEGYLSDQ